MYHVDRSMYIPRLLIVLWQKSGHVQSLPHSPSLKENIRWEFEAHVSEVENRR